MRKLALLMLPIAFALTLNVAAQPDAAKTPYRIEFDPATDVEPLDKAEGKEGIFVKVRFAITLDGNRVEKLDDHKIVIEENGKRITTVDVPRPVPSEALSVMLVMDTSGSMKEHRRMAQAREASAVFLSKLSPRSDCGLILFDHEIREKQPLGFDRASLLKKIKTTEPRGGTAYLDATSEGVKVLRQAPPGRDRALILVTDGIDLNSNKTIKNVIDEAMENKVRIYTIGIGEPGKLEQVSTVLVLDHSGSMRPPADDNDTTPKIEALHLAGFKFVDSMSTKGRTSIIPFSSTVGKVRPFLSKETKTDKDENALKTIIKRLAPEGETALFDATYTGIGVLDADGYPGKQAVIAMTDGWDNSSRRRVKEVTDYAKAAKVPLYMLGFGRDGEIDTKTMTSMAEETGGKYYHAKNKDALLEIFENLSIQLHDDGIDEDALKKISKGTGGQYYPAKNVSDLKLILAQVSQSILRETHEIVFPSKIQSADGTARTVTLKLVRRGAGGSEETIQETTGGYQMRGLVVAEMNHFIYLVLLVAFGGLIALPGLLRRSPSV